MEMFYAKGVLTVAFDIMFIWVVNCCQMLGKIVCFIVLLVVLTPECIAMLIHKCIQAEANLDV